MATLITGSGVDKVIDGSITSTKIADGTITNADVNDVAASKLTGALPAIDGSNLTGLGGGLSEADQWRVHTSFSGGGVITTNLERNDTASFTKLGTGMTQSSGVFAFPSTGYWLVTFNLNFELNQDNFTSSRIQGTLNNGSSWLELATSYCSSASNAHYHSVEMKEIVDITDISNQKVRFFSGAGVTTTASSSSSLTSMTFIKLGET